MTTEAPKATPLSGMPLNWLLGARFAVLLFALSAVGVAVAFFDRASQELALRLLAPLLMLFVVGAASWWWSRKRQTSKAFTGAQLTVDVALVTGIVYATGGAISPFLFLYLPLVMAAALLVSRASALTTAALSGLAYGVLVTSMKAGWLPAFDGSLGVATPSGGLALQIVGLMSAMVLIAVATSYLVSTISKRDALVEQSKRDLQALSDRQHMLLQSVPEAVCLCDKYGKFVEGNPPALELLARPRPELQGKLLIELLRDRTPGNVALEGAPLLSGEIILPGEEGSDQVTLNVTTKPLPADSVGALEGGYLTVFNDVSKLKSIEEQLELHERMARLIAETSAGPTREARGERSSDFVGESAIMRKVFALITRVAKSDATVIVHGESGTGKELVAKSIHRESTRARGPFVAVNCGAIPENLIESELFGHRKGAFTGAHADYTGLFQRASGGTLFLDEIGELPLAMQAKLLRAIQEKSVRPVGGERDIAVDVRIVAATNRNLKRAVEEGQFREDLFYRLNVISINLPALRERKEDIPLLVNSILQRLMADQRGGGSSAQETGAVVPPQTMHVLNLYSYPGNVRELENIIERAFVLGGSVILREHLPENVRQAVAELESGSFAPRRETEIIIDESIQFPVDLDKVLNTLERRYLESALEKSGGVKKRAADLLGINFRSLRYRLQKFGMGDGQ